MLVKTLSIDSINRCLLASIANNNDILPYLKIF